MKIVTANGKRSLKMTKAEWLEIGKKAQWSDSYKDGPAEENLTLLQIKKLVNGMGTTGTVSQFEEIARLATEAAEEAKQQAFEGSMGSLPTNI